MKKKILLIIGIAVILLAGIAAYVMIAKPQVVEDIFEKKISAEETDRKAQDYVSEKFPDMKDAELLSEKKDPESKYWSYVYRKEFTVNFEGEEAFFPSVLVIEVDRSSGEVVAYKAN